MGHFILILNYVKWISVWCCHFSRASNKVCGLYIKIDPFPFSAIVGIFHEPCYCTRFSCHNMAKISQSAVESLRSTVESACSEVQGIPGVSVVVVNKDGKELFAHSAGRRGVGSTEKMSLDNIFWIASCTKMIAGIACMQLVEKGLLALDDASSVEQLCPELRDVKVLTSKGKLVEKNMGITLRMLLTHTGKFIKCHIKYTQ
jgi:CubicO group peptidase (beta-lactamase class C family)